MSDPVISCVDRWGRRIVASQRQWSEHILFRHAELTEQHGSVEAAIVRPSVVTHDARFTDHELFYGQVIRPLGSPVRYMRVCVEISSEDQTGTVITAHITGRISPKERIKWP